MTHCKFILALIFIALPLPSLAFYTCDGVPRGASDFAEKLKSSEQSHEIMASLNACDEENYSNYSFQMQTYEFIEQHRCKFKMENSEGKKLLSVKLKKRTFDWPNLTEKFTSDIPFHGMFRTLQSGNTIFPKVGRISWKSKLGITGGSFYTTRVLVSDENYTILDILYFNSYGHMDFIGDGQKIITSQRKLVAVPAPFVNGFEVSMDVEIPADNEHELDNEEYKVKLNCEPKDSSSIFDKLFLLL